MFYIFPVIGQSNITYYFFNVMYYAFCRVSTQLVECVARDSIDTKNIGAVYIRLPNWVFVYVGSWRPNFPSTRPPVLTPSCRVVGLVQWSGRKRTRVSYEYFVCQKHNKIIKKKLNTDRNLFWLFRPKTIINSFLRLAGRVWSFRNNLSSSLDVHRVARIALDPGYRGIPTVL